MVTKSNTPITIKMPKELLAQWLAALRSGKFQQGTGKLHVKATNKYCCLGVLQKVADGECEPRGLPSTEWLASHNVEFFDVHGRTKYVSSPYLPSVLCGAHAANDHGTTDGKRRLDFLQIADAIEYCAVGV